MFQEVIFVVKVQIIDVYAPKILGDDKIIRVMFD